MNERMNHPKYLEMGDIYNRLTIIGVEGNSMWRKDGKRQQPSRWKYWCKCNCEKSNIVAVSKIHLVSGNIKSCGCLAREVLIERNKKMKKINLIKVEGVITKIFFFNAPGEYTIIDTEDYDKVKDFCWFKVVGDKGDTYVEARTKGQFDRTLIKLHQVLCPCKKGLVPDHKNGNGLDNRKGNLRSITQRQNVLNSAIRSDNTSGHTGVGYNKEIQKWTAVISIDKKVRYLGSYVNKEDAIKVRREAEELYYGEYSRRKSRGE